MVGESSMWQLIYTEYKRAIGEKTFDLGGQSSRRTGMWRWRRPSGLLRDDIAMLPPLLKPHLPPQRKHRSRGQVKRFNFKQLLFLHRHVGAKAPFCTTAPTQGPVWAFALGAGQVLRSYPWLGALSVAVSAQRGPREHDGDSKQRGAR